MKLIWDSPYSMTRDSDMKKVTLLNGDWRNLEVERDEDDDNYFDANFPFYIDVTNLKKSEELTARSVPNEDGDKFVLIGFKEYQDEDMYLSAVFSFE